MVRRVEAMGPQPRGRPGRSTTAPVRQHLVGKTTEEIAAAADDTPVESMIAVYGPDPDNPDGPAVPTGEEVPGLWFGHQEGVSDDVWVSLDWLWGWLKYEISNADCPSS